MKSTRLIILAVAAAALAAPALAQAHVTVQPESVPAGGFTRLDVRVPNELDDASTENVEVEMPDGFLFVSYEPVEGWSVDVKSEKLDEPAEAFGEEITEQIRSVTWTADDPNAAIQPGQFRDFGLSVGMPEEYVDGDTLTFPALQTYDNGEVVRWIGEPDSEEPAAQITLTEAAEDHHEAEAEESEGAEEAAADDSEEAEDDDDGASTGLVIAALILGALGLITGGIALARR